MNISEIKRFLSFQHNALDFLEFLIKFDREQALKNNVPAEKTIVLKAFIDSQRKSLDMATLLLEKHEPALKQVDEAKAKAEKEKLIKEQAESKKHQVAKTPVNTQKETTATEVGLFDTLQEGEA